MARSGTSVKNYTTESGVLKGITRKTVIELAAEKDIPLEARAVPADEVRGADEVFLTSTAGGIMPVTKVDGKPGPITLQLREAYWALQDDPRFATPVRY